MTKIADEYVGDVKVLIFDDTDGQRRVTITDDVGHIRWESVELAMEFEPKEEVRQFLVQYTETEPV